MAYKIPRRKGSTQPTPKDEIPTAKHHRFFFADFLRPLPRASLLQSFLTPSFFIYFSILGAFLLFSTTGFLFWYSRASSVNISFLCFSDPPRGAPSKAENLIRAFTF